MSNTREHDNAMVRQAKEQHRQDMKRLEAAREAMQKIEEKGYAGNTKEYMDAQRELNKAEKDAKASEYSSKRLQEEYTNNWGN